MGEIVNLRLARKRKARSLKEAEAAQNRVAHGRLKSERETSEAQAALEARRFESHFLGPEKRDDGEGA